MMTNIFKTQTLDSPPFPSLPSFNLPQLSKCAPMEGSLP